MSTVTLSAQAKIHMSKAPHDNLEEAPAEDGLIDIACGATGLELQTEEAEEMEVTTLCDKDPQFMRTFAGRSTGSIPIFYSSKEDSAYSEVRKAAEDGKNRYFCLELPDGGKEEFIAYIGSHNISIQTKQAVMANMSLKLSGNIKRTASKEGEA